MGQIRSDEGDQDLAIDSLIEALRWDPKNAWALLMMGNIMAKFKKDIPTAIKFYNQTLVVKPDDHITINNIGANLMQQGKIIEAKEFFNKALSINDQYVNAHFAIGMIGEIENDFFTAFSAYLNALRLNKKKDDMYRNSMKQVFRLAQKIIIGDKGKDILEKYLHTLEFEGDKEIVIKEDSNIATAAKFELAENYNREKHSVVYNAKYPAYEHLIMHELVHLDFVIKARKAQVNQLFISGPTHKKDFIRGLDATVKQLKKKGISEESINKYCSGLFDGLNLQVYNTPIDLFIENFLFSEYPDLQAYQLISLHTILQEGIMAVTDPQTVELSPVDILSKSKIYNMILAFQFRELFGIDLLNEYQATKAEKELALKFYEEYLQYKNDKEPGEEYELVQHWAEDLKLDKYFELEGEIQYRRRGNIDEFFDALEKDPGGLSERDPHKEREMKKFLESQGDLEINMAVVKYMVDALQYLNNKQNTEIKEIAFQIAMMGTQGISPENKDYKIPAINNKIFSGYHLLAYYYVSWKLAVPEMLNSLQLPFDKEYDLAYEIYKSHGNE